MLKRLLRIISAMFCAFLFTIPLYWMIDVSPIELIWLAFWCISVGLLVDTSSMLVRGFGFLTVSVAMGITGTVYVKLAIPEGLWLVEYLSNVLMLVGSAVGATLIAQHFVHQANLAQSSSSAPHSHTASDVENDTESSEKTSSKNDTETMTAQPDTICETNKHKSSSEAAAKQVKAS